MTATIAQRIAQEISANEKQVAAAVALLDEGDTVPFIARYRKEVTGGLDDIQLRLLEERLGYLRELEDRRNAILASIAEQDKLTPELEKDIKEADTKTRLEDLYLPYKPKRRTKAQIAREAGLAPLAEMIVADVSLVPEEAAAAFVDAEKGVADVKAALEGARHILAEQWSEDAELLGKLREFLWQHGEMKSRVAEGKQEAGEKFRDYFDYAEPIKNVPSHRALALFRGRNEGFLFINLTLEENAEGKPAAVMNSCERIICQHLKLTDNGKPGEKWLIDAARWTWRIKFLTHLELELFMRLRENAEGEAIKVFGRNLHALLLAAPAGPRAVIGLDPGLRTGTKIAVVDRTGKLLDHTTIYPHQPRNDWEGSLHVLTTLAKKHGAELISIGNGTASRETDKLATELIKRQPELKLQKLVVSEAGASVYSASEFASKEFPDLDVSIRGAVSIARRLQDPLAELVKIDPKAIGVGQYQHDVSQVQLARSLDAVVEDCVNKVGVDVNTASAPLLTRVSGLNQTLATNIVSFRDANGPFKNRKALMAVPRMGEKTFEQAAGFLRVMSGDNPVDASSVHPEAYPVVERIADKLKLDIRSLIGNTALLKSLKAEEFTDDKFGLPTVRDIIVELEKPGRDPRPEFKTASFKEGVEDLKDLLPGMMLEGVITNVTNFGAFVDIGVHQDGLVHISAMSKTFIKDPREVVKSGDIVKVKVLEVQVARKRIALTLRLDDETGKSQRPAPCMPRDNSRASMTSSSPRKPQEPSGGGALAEALRRAAEKNGNGKTGA